ncbi:hypothetical protein LH51_11605 [Nitrincola sp. A-D6]|uniref:PAS domain-containing protein n=1 Tax=Nitrincola sp. A-D6 TaxID=1545442 RepID=UPI00051FD736|nr:PAS domain-containing protein [Nitrincola sp. A-D6]KGK41871.1 hypothetical protein LH51_11605 [Nitrincola sp. A-D6]
MFFNIKQKNLTRLCNFVDCFQVAVLLLDRDNNIKHMNQPCIDILEHTASEVKNKPLDKIMAKNSLAQQGSGTFLQRDIYESRSGKLIELIFSKIDFDQHGYKMAFVDIIDPPDPLSQLKIQAFNENNEGLVILGDDNKLVLINDAVRKIPGLEKLRVDKDFSGSSIIERIARVEVQKS